MIELIRKSKNYLLLEVAIPVIDLFLRTKIHHYLCQIRQMNEWSADKIEIWQNERIQILVKHFYTNTIYYRRLFDKIGLTPDDIKTKEDLLKIPLLNKDIIREHYAELIPSNIDLFPHKKASSGGSSGKTLRYFLDNNTWSYTTAIKIYSWQTSGYLYGDTYATIGSSSLFSTNPTLKQKFYHLFKSSLRISGLNLSDDKISEIIPVLIRKKPKYLYGYAAALFLLAKYVNKNRIKIPSIKGCFPTAEMLTPEYRSEIEKAFGFVMDCYGARDGGITAYEINKGYYNVGYNSVAEVIDCYDKNTGKLLVTDLFSFAFPFLRYDLDDDVTLAENNHTYNYNGQVITKIMGRSPDIIRLSNGHVLTGPAFQMMFGSFNVSAYRISKLSDLILQIEIQPNEMFTDDEENKLFNILTKHAGEDCKIVLLKVEEFVPNKNGKRNYFIA
jgi:phenylacetate-CoA ligase